MRDCLDVGCRGIRTVRSLIRICSTLNSKTPGDCEIARAVTTSSRWTNIWTPCELSRSRLSFQCMRSLGTGSHQCGRLRLNSRGRASQLISANTSPLCSTRWSIAFQTDSTRMASMMFANDVSGRSFSFVEGVSGGHHELSNMRKTRRRLRNMSVSIVSMWSSLPAC